MVTDWLRRAWAALLQGVPGDIRSALVGAVVALFISWLVSPSPPREIELLTNAQGFGKPMPTLMAEVARDELPTTFKFQPVGFENVYVCEYSHLVGQSGREMMLAYLSKYAMCFSVIQNTADAYTIKPNPNAPVELQNNGKDWLCRCG